MSVKAILREASRFLHPLQASISSATGVQRLLERLGFVRPKSDFTPMDGELQSVTEAISDVQEVVEAYLDGDTPDANPLDLLQKVVDAVDAVNSLLPAFMAAGLPGSVLTELLDLLLANYLAVRTPALFRFLIALGVIEGEVNNTRETEYLAFIFRWERLPCLLTSPEGLLEEVYGWSTVHFDHRLLLYRLENFLDALGLTVFIDEPEGAFLEKFLPSAVSAEVKPWILQFPLFHNQTEDGSAEVFFGLVLAAIEGSGPTDIGISIMPQLEGSIEGAFELTDEVEVFLTGEGEVTGGVVAAFRPVSRFTVSAGILDDTAACGTFRFGVRKSGEQPILLFGSPGEIRLEVQQMETAIYASLDNTRVDFGTEAALEGGAFIIQSSEPDSFLNKILPEDPIAVHFDLTLGVSLNRGFYFGGEAALEVTIPLHQELGPLSIESLYLSLGASGGSDLSTTLEGRVGASFGIELGPLSGSVERLGLRVPISFSSDRKGNLGPVDIGFGFLPPTGAGFAMNAGVLVGGGFLDFDDDNKRYAGALALRLGEIGVTAIGLITTRMPDGSEGFSMLVNISITFNPAIQIYMGFTLAGVGGLVGVNRTMQTDVLREGLKKGTLDSILFPDPATVISNAVQIISDMRAVFPPEEGRFIIGPMIIIGWGTPTIITGEIGVFIEIPDPVRIVLMGQVEMGIPDPDEIIVGVNIDILGVLELEKKELSFQASIYGSSLMAFELWGDCAFLLSWGSQPEFALTIGGFHPKFTPPPPPGIFANLRRLGININYGPVIQLQCSGYLALTPNSFQFGAQVGVFVGISELDVGIAGFISFDCLVIFSPFSFEVGVGGGMTVSVLSQTLAEIRVNFTLSGPTPWNVRGIGTVNALFFEIDIGFNISWGRDDPARLDPVNPWPILKEALQRAESWGSRLPSTASIAVALRQIEDESVVVADDEDPLPTPVIVHPAGTLEIRQNVAPLEVTFAKFGNAPIQNYDRFRIAKVTTGDGVELLSKSVAEFFARGQFEQLSNSQKLSIPSFEKMQGGVTTHSSSRVAIMGESASVKTRYDTTLIKSDRTSKPADNHDAAVSKWSEARFLVAGNAARRCALRAQGHARFTHRGIGMVGTKEEKYVVVDAVNLQPVVDLDARIDVPAGDLTRTQADQVLAQQLLLHSDQTGQLIVIAEYEVEEAS